MDINRIKEFVLIQETGNLSAAAEELGISTATLSARLSSFEKSLGQELFTRTKSGLELNEAGRRFLPHAYHIVDRENFLKMKILEDTEDYNISKIRICTSGQGLPPYLGPYLDIINMNHPDIRIDLWDSAGKPADQALRSGEFDIVFTYAVIGTEFEGIRTQQIAPAHATLTLSTRNPLSERDFVRLEDLDGETFVLFNPNNMIYEHEFQLKNLLASGIRFQTYESHSSSGFTPLMVPIGKGVFLSPRNEFLEPPNCVVLPVKDLKYPAPPCILYLEDCPNPEVRKFIDGYMKFRKEATTGDHRPFV